MIRTMAAFAARSAERAVHFWNVSPDVASGGRRPTVCPVTCPPGLEGFQ
jgi:hypothetical protein